MGKAAAEIGATVAARKFSGKLGTTIIESTVIGMKKAYKLKKRLNRHRKEDESSMIRLPQKK